MDSVKRLSRFQNSLERSSRRQYKNGSSPTLRHAELTLSSLLSKLEKASKYGIVFNT